MSTGGPGGREVAYRIFATEYDDATYTYAESDEERAPNYVVSPTGARINRLFVVGVVTETEWVNDETIRARLVDPTGAFVLYASQYQPDARATLDEIEPPAFLAVTGKANTFRPDGADRVYTSVRPEAVGVVDAATRDRWAVSTAEHTISRLGALASALEGEEPIDRGREIALAEYEPTPAYAAKLYERCIDVLRLVAGEIDSMPERSTSLNATEAPAVPLTEIIEVGSRIGPAIARTGSPSDGQTAALESDQTFETAEGPSDPDEPVLSSAERAEVESEFGTDFTTGDEIATEPSAELSESMSEEPDDPEPTELEDVGEPIEDLDPEPSPDPATDEEIPDDAPADGPPTVDDAVELMHSLDTGDGVDFDQLLEAFADRFDIQSDTAEELVESALLEGRCYKAGDDVIQPI